MYMSHPPAPTLPYTLSAGYKMARVHEDVIRLPLIGAEVIPSPRLVFHVGYISDRRVIKAAINV